uniref:ARAD1B06908p n=1 Tax=Blastobotrys adeninivorans TaxID=409370 RepID=A0A060TBD9_BLAAD
MRLNLLLLALLSVAGAEDLNHRAARVLDQYRGPLKTADPAMLYARQDASSTASASETSSAESSSASSSAESSSATSSAESSSASSSAQSSSATSSAESSSASSSVTSSQSSSASSSSASSTTAESSSSTNSVPTPVVTVPSMDGNPYMQYSKMPEGTVFIVFGAVLGFLALCLIIWRVAASISFRKAVRRGAYAVPMGQTGGAFGGPGGDKPLLYPGDPTRSGDSAAGGAGGSLTSESGRPSFMGRNSMFFSPTADVMTSAHMASSSLGGAGSSTATATGAGGGGHSSMSSISGVQAAGVPGQRSSAYLPAGYYNPGAPAAGSLSSRNAKAMSMRESLYNAPGSARTSVYHGASGSHRPQQRAPSAYLDDLLGHDNH